MTFRKFMWAALLTSLQVSAVASTEESADSYKSALYYEVKNTEFLSEQNEFNTELDALASIQITPYWINQTKLDAVPEPNQSDIKVCIVDSGVSSAHEDLFAINMEGSDFKYGGAWEVDSVGHGTHIAGIIGASNNSYGVRGAINNGQVDIQVEKVLRTASGNNSTIRDRDVIRAIKNCAEAGANIINISLGSTVYSEKLRKVIDRLYYKNDIIFVAAAGNHGLASGYDLPGYPAAFRNVIGVGAVNLNGELANFSPAFAGLDLVAPGMDILSTIPQDVYRVRDVFFQSEDIYYPYQFTQIDNGTFEYPQVLPSQSSCYHYISDSTVEEQLTHRELSSESRKDIRKASKQCKADGGEVIVLTYDYLSLSEKEQFQDTNPWLTSLEFEAKMPTLLMPGLNSNEIEQFRQGNMHIDAALQGYAAYSGTSQAAAVVTAGIAKIWANLPQANAEQVINSLKLSAEDLEYDYPENAIGNGLVDFSEAYTFLANYEDAYSAPQCPQYWYDNQGYKRGEQVSYKGFTYEASKRNKDTRPVNSDGESEVWKQVGECEHASGSEPDYYDTDFIPTYELSEVERIEVIYKCKSYFLSCGGASFGGFVGFSGMSYSGGSGGEGGGGGGGSASGSGNSSDGELTPEQEKKKQEEYEDLKKRVNNQPKKKPGESDENYYKRMKQYYEKLAEDYKKWDKKWGKVGRHDDVIRRVLNTANNFNTKYVNKVNHRLNQQGFRGVANSVCKAKVPARAKFINVIGCYAAKKLEP